MRKTLKTLAAVTALALAGIFVPVAASASMTATECVNLAGSGVDGEPFLISTQANLMAVSNCNTQAGGGAFFQQTANIVLQGNWVPLVEFDGVYDGNYWSISGLNVNDTSQGLAGLFTYLNGATVKNLSLLANDIIAESYAGVLAGYGSDVVIENVRAKALGKLDVIYGAGCVLGSAHGSVSITGAFADCNTDPSVGWAGGLVGYLGSFQYPVTDLTIESAYVRGNLSFSSTGGGIAAIFSSVDTAAEISGFTFAGNLLAPDNENARVGGLFGSAASASSTVAAVTAVTNSSIRGTISSELVTEQPAPPQIIITPSSTDFSIATAVDKDTTPFNPSPTVGYVAQAGPATPRFVLSKLILAPKYGTPTNSDGYQVNVGTPLSKGVPIPNCVFHTEPAVAGFEYNQTAHLTLVTPIQIRDISTFAGCLDVADGLENLNQDDVWVKSPSIFAGDVWGAQLVHLGLHESTVNYGQPSFEIQHDEMFSILNSGWNFFPEFSIEPALPAGITIESHTGRIIGSASEPFGPTEFTVTRTSLFDFATQTASITLSQLPAVGDAQPAQYSGPIINSVSPNPVRQGEELTVLGSRLDQVELVTIGDSTVLAAQITRSANELSFIVPVDAELGQQELSFAGAFGSLRFQDGVVVNASVDEINAQRVRFEVRELPNRDLKLYAFGVVNQGKIQFMVDGRELAWVRAVSSADSRLRSIATATGTEHYLVRTLKNSASSTIEFYLNGQLVQSHTR